MFPGDRQEERIKKRSKDMNFKTEVFGINAGLQVGIEGSGIRLWTDTNSMTLKKLLIFLKFSFPNSYPASCLEDYSG